MRSIEDILAEIDDGKLREEINAGLRQAVAGVVETGAAGAVTLKLTITRNARTVLVKGSVATKIPRRPTEAAVFWPTEDGELHREDPKQQRLPHVSPTPIRAAREKE